MGYDLYNIDDKIIVKSDKKVGFLSKNPQNELEVSGSTWAKNVTGINFSGTTGYFDILKINEPINVTVVNTEIQNTTEIYYQENIVIAQNVTGNIFSGISFSGEEFYFNLFTGDNIYSENIFSNNLKGENFYIDGIKFLDEKNKILTNNSFFPFTINSLLGPPGDITNPTLTATFNGSSNAGYLKIDEFSTQRDFNDTEKQVIQNNIPELLGGDLTILNYSINAEFSLKIGYSGIFNSEQGYLPLPVVLISPADKNAGLFLKTVELRPQAEFFEIIFKSVPVTGIYHITVLENREGYMEFRSLKNLGKWHYMIIG